MKTPTCGGLLFSWFLFVGGTCAMQFLPDTGMLIALLIGPIWQSIRGSHDQEIADWLFRGSGIAPKLAATYYVLTCITFALLVLKGYRVDHLPLGVCVVVIMFPPLVAMAVTDHRVCSKQRNSSAD